MQLGELPRSPFNGRGILRSKSCADSPVPTANILSAFIPWGGSLCLKVPTSQCVDGKDPVTLSFDRIGILCMPRDGSRELKRVATYGPENHHILLMPSRSKALLCQCSCVCEHTTPQLPRSFGTHCLLHTRRRPLTRKILGFPKGARHDSKAVAFPDLPCFVLHITPSALFGPHWNANTTPMLERCLLLVSMQIKRPSSSFRVGQGL